MSIVCVGDLEGVPSPLPSNNMSKFCVGDSAPFLAIFEFISAILALTIGDDANFAHIIRGEWGYVFLVINFLVKLSEICNKFV